MIKSITVVSKGALNSSCITMKEILSEPIKQMAASIIIVHNHPSGDTTPSRADVTFTKNVIENARLFDIEVMDHIVIGKDNYTSIKEMYSDIFLKGRLI
jgi:DNA repair protein RadC